MNKPEPSKIAPIIAVPLSFVIWFFTALVTIVCFLTGLLLFMPVTILLRKRTDYVMHRIAVFWAKSILFLNPLWNLEVSGGESLNPEEPFMVVSNHQSLVDILILLASLPVHFKFLSKREVFKMPFIGWHMYFAGYIAVDRSSRESGKLAVQEAGKRLANSAGVLFFPEGTRSVDGQIKNFKPGAFKLAVSQGVRILPVIVDGTGDAVPKNSLVMEKKSPLKVAIGQPVDTKDAKWDELLGSIHEQMISNLANLRGEK